MTSKLNDLLDVCIVSLLNIHDLLHPHLKSKVNQFIRQKQWCIPHGIFQFHPNLSQILLKVAIPIEPRKDRLQWKLSH